MSFNPLIYSISFDKPRRLTDVNSWHEHIPFAFTIVQMIKPKVIVELGTHKGDSYCAFCQAVNRLKLDTACYAVDSWEGDKHSGLYGHEILEELRNYHDPLYGRFSRLIQSPFDEALNYFSNGSVDLLHIDGLHTYDAVKHDFENWLSKISRNGVVLIHDTNVREREFGVWLFWQELKDKYPSFEFKHGHGLGVLAVGDDVSVEVLDFMDMAQQNLVVISDFFSYLGNKISLQHKVKEQNARIFEFIKLAQAKDEQITDLNNAIQTKDAQVINLNNAIQTKDAQIINLNNAIQTKDAQIINLNNTLNAIHQSITWRMVTKYHIIMERLLPQGTRRRRSYNLGFRELRIIANEGLRSFFRISKIYTDQGLSSFEELPWEYTGSIGKTFGKITILLTSHEASQTGAPLALLGLLTELSQRSEFECWVLLNSRGPLESEFKKYAPTLNLDKLTQKGMSRHSALATIASRYQRYASSVFALCNTAATPDINEIFASHGIPVFSWIHELPTSIDVYFGGEETFRNILHASKRIICPAEYVKEALVQCYKPQDPV